MKLFFYHLHVYFCTKFHFLLVKCRRPPGLVYDLGVQAGFPKNAYITDAKSQEPVIISSAEGSVAFIKFSKRGELFRKVQDPVSWHTHSVGKTCHFHCL